jgi:hypothetical protein
LKKKAANYYSKGERNANSVQARTGLEGSRRLKYPDFIIIGTWW